MTKQKVVIIGGGFGGVKAALEVSEAEAFSVSLVSDQKHLRYYPSLYRSATGGSRAQSVIPLSEIFAGHPVKLINDRAVKISRTDKTIIMASGKVMAYDILVLALGVVTNYFGIKGLEKYSYGIKSIEEASGFKHHLHQQLIDHSQPDLNYVVIGGGPTGVELAGVLPVYIKHIMRLHGIRHRAVNVSLVEATPRLLPRLPKDVSRAVARRLRRMGVKLYLNKKVEGETAESLMVEGKPILSNTVVWTAGVTNHPFLKENGLDLAPNGKVEVDQFLAAEKDIYVIGDNANTLYSGTAQAALHDAKFVANNLKRISAGRLPEAYKPAKPVYVVPVGAHWAAVLWGKVRIYGRVGWLLRRLADLVAFHDLEPWHKASKQWLAEYESEEDCLYCDAAVDRAVVSSNHITVSSR